MNTKKHNHTEHSISTMFLAAAATLILYAFSGCGVQAGSFVAGSTSFLAEHNRVERLRVQSPQSSRSVKTVSVEPARKERITAEDRAEMDAFLNQEYRD